MRAGEGKQLGGVMAISANRAGSNRRLLRALLCVSPALCAGCGSSFEEGDEAWIHVPGEVLLLDEYIVVEIDRFSDRCVEVEPDGSDFRKPITGAVLGDSPYHRRFLRRLGRLNESRPRRLTNKLEQEGSECVDADRLISPDEAEDAYEATVEMLNSLSGLEDGGSPEVVWDFLANEADADDIRAALETA